MKDTSIIIINKLKDAGHNAYWAGGSVRDFLLGKNPKDFDIVTSAKPDEIEDLLGNTIPIGKRFGVILVVEGDYHYEVATFRSDASYTDGRRPDAVFFSSPKEDARRRDFTINGMFYDPLNNEILDYVNGQKDLKEKVVRFIGEAAERIKEDNLRLLRAIRFKNALGFHYAPGTKEAIKNNSHLIANVSKERIFDELTKILLLPGRENAFLELDETGLLDQILPEVCQLKGVNQPELYHKEGDVFAHAMMSLEALPDIITPELAWATLLHDIAKPLTYSETDRIRFNKHAEVGSQVVRAIATRTGFPNELRERVMWLVSHHMMLGNILNMKQTRQLHWVTMPLFDDLLELLRADSLGTEPKSLELYDEIKKLKKRLIKKKSAPPPNLLTGTDIITEFKVPEGPIIGKILRQVREAQLEEEIKTKAEAKSFAKKLISQNRL